MEFDILDNGDLRIVASPEDQAGLDTPEDWDEMFHEAVNYDGWCMVDPADVGALTDAPLVCDDAHTVEDDGTFVLYPEAKVWWFPNYMVEDPMATLRETGEVIFTAASMIEGARFMARQESQPQYSPLTRTKAALEEYDQERARLEAELEKAWDDLGPKGEGVGRIMWLTNRIDARGEPVGIAFGHDTAGINSMDKCRDCVRPGPALPRPGCKLSFVRRCVQQWEQGRS